MAGQEADYQGLKVLVVEDDQAVRGLVCKMLGRVGISDIVEAGDGSTGFRELLEHHPDLVLCDIHMKPVNGQDFLRHVRDSSTEWVRKTPIIFLTSDHYEDSVQRAVDHEVDGYLVKPVSLADLRKHLASALNRRRA